jgi:hypothetical protein
VLEDEEIAGVMNARRVKAQLQEPTLQQVIFVLEQNAFIPGRNMDKSPLKESCNVVVESGQINVVARRADISDFWLRRNFGVGPTKPEKTTTVIVRLDATTVQRGGPQVLPG